MKYFGHDHLLHTVLAIYVCCINFNLVPFLLLYLYPCRCFQSCLNCCRPNSHALRIFMDAFQGCYKFEPYDCRYWAAFYLFLRIAFLSIFSITQLKWLLCCYMWNTANSDNNEHSYCQAIQDNIIDVVLLLVFIQILFSAAGLPFGSFNKTVEVFLITMLVVGLTVPLVYIAMLAVYKILPKTWITFIMEHIILHLFCHQSHLQRDVTLLHITTLKVTN